MAADMRETDVGHYLQRSEVMDFEDEDVLRQAHELAAGSTDPAAIAKRCFEWVRDEIKHSGDFQMDPTTCKASEVLRHGSGWCFAKSHLLAAFLRANGVPAGLCYQRLARNGRTALFTLHGLNAVHLPEYGWYRVDPRGNRPGVNAEFAPPREQLAWPIKVSGEGDLPGVYSDPLPEIVSLLNSHATWRGVRDNLPDTAVPVSQGDAIT